MAGAILAELSGKCGDLRGKKVMEAGFGKRAAERKGKWPYGPEFPVKSLMGECETAGLTVMGEYHICFRDNRSYLFHVLKILKSIVKVTLLPFPNDFLIKIFGGYLLVTVAVEQQR